MDLIDSVLNRIEKKNESQDGLLATKESLQAHATDHANPHAVSKEQVGLGNADNTSDLDKPVSVAQQSAILDAVTRSGTYTDRKIADLINGAPETLDTLKEIADAITENETVVDAINEAIGKKADKEALGAYLPLTGGTITKGGNVPLVISNDGGNYLGVILKADSNAFGESNIRLTSEATSSEKRFMIQEVTEETKNLFQLSESNRKVYDSNSKSLKKILVEGEALPATGGKISGNTNPLLNIERTTEGGSASLKLTPGNGTKGGILIQSNYRESGNQFLVIRQNELNEILNLFAVSETQRQIHDYKTGTLKEILVQGDPADSIKLPRVYSGNANYKPGKDIFEIKEFSNNSNNIPTSNWYHIITMQGNDAEEKYIAQLAVGETIDALYYRNLNKNVYSKWYKILFAGDALPTTGEGVHSAYGIAGQKGYVKFASLKINSTFVDHPITLILSKRHLGIPTKVSILFNGTSTKDPELNKITYQGIDNQISIARSGEGTWDFYVKKYDDGGHDNLTVFQVLKSSSRNQGKFDITWKDEQVDSLPDNAVYNVKYCELDEIKDFILINQQGLNFTNNICTIFDERITGNSLADVYFTSDTIATAENADIYVETYDKNVKLTANNPFTGTIKATIRIGVI